MKKALIALDIDGTLAPAREAIPTEVVDHLHALQTQGHAILFMTGRTFTFARTILPKMEGIYYLGVQNGAAIVEMPSKKVLYRQYLSPDLFPILDQIFRGASVDYLVESGVENEDRCYFRVDRHNEEQLAYLYFREKLANEEWQGLASFTENMKSPFPLIKFFGDKEVVRGLAGAVEKQLHLHIPVIHDPFKDNGHIAMGTHPDASKGSAISSLRSLLGTNLMLVAAGDDYNDVSMLEAADFGIAMETGPQNLLAAADFIAPSAVKQGVVKGLQEAFKHLGIDS